MAADIRKNQGKGSEETHERIDHAADRIKQEADRAAQQTKDTVDATTDRAETRVRQATDASARGAHHAADKSVEWRERGSAAVGSMRDRAGNLFDDACECVREKPVESVAIALAAGCLIGWLLSSRR